MTKPSRTRNDEWKDDLNTNNESYDSDISSDMLNENSSYDYKFKICLLGDCGVGKTSLIKRYIRNIFSDTTSDNPTSDNDEIDFVKNKATIGMDCLKTVKIMRGHKIAIELWDTAGQERFNAITANYLRSANAVLLIYDMTDKASFESIKNKWLKFVKDNLTTNDYGTPEARLAIVANKLDLSDDRVVAKKEAVKLSTTNNCRFFEASAKTGQNVKELFRSICDSICDYWCDLRGDPNFFPPDSKPIKLHKNKRSVEKNRSSCKC